MPLGSLLLGSRPVSLLAAPRRGLCADPAHPGCGWCCWSLSGESPGVPLRMLRTLSLCGDSLSYDSHRPRGQVARLEGKSCCFEWQRDSLQFPSPFSPLLTVFLLRWLQAASAMLS